MLHMGPLKTKMHGLLIHKDIPTSINRLNWINQLYYVRLFFKQRLKILTVLHSRAKKNVVVLKKRPATFKKGEFKILVNKDSELKSDGKDVYSWLCPRKDCVCGDSGVPAPHREQVKRRQAASWYLTVCWGHRRRCRLFPSVGCVAAPRRPVSGGIIITAWELTPPLTVWASRGE